MRCLAFLLMPLALAGCAVGPNYHPPASLKTVDSSLTAAIGNRAVVTDPLPGRWWGLFDNADLDRLVEKALVHNYDIRIASANLQRARALLREAGAARLPLTDVSANAKRGRTAPNQGGTGTVSDFYSVGFDASYEVDLFGGVSRSIEAARGDVGAAQAQLDASRVAIAAETARTFADACGFGLQANVARTTAKLQQQTLDLTKRLFSGGGVSQQEVDQSTVLVEQANAEIATFNAERLAALYALAVLTGDTPASIDAAAEACAIVPVVDRPIPIGDGQSLLARRPDVRSAERTLAADTARIGVATAALFPSITLLGSINLGAGDVNDIGKKEGLSWSAGPLISWNFPFSGAARARVRESKAVAEGSLATFDKTVLTALQETQQALARLAGALDREAALTRARDAADHAAFLSGKRFAYGAESFLQLLDAQRTLAGANASLASAQVDRAEAQIALFKALGGGWAAGPNDAPSKPIDQP